MQGNVSADFEHLPADLSGDEKWMINKLEEASKTISEELDKFRFHAAAHALYNLVWSDFCDWFVEAEKLPMRAGGKDKERALAVLDYALNKILKLLHPFMPFITEELAHRMGFISENDTIMYAKWPESDVNAAFSAESIKEIEGKFEMVRAGRFLRSSYNFPDGKKLRFHIKAADSKMLAFLKAEAESLKLLLNAEDVEISAEAFDSAANGAAPSQLVKAGVISLPLAGLIDVAAEKAKLEKQLKDLDNWINGAKAKLSNEKFVNGAPAQVVADARTKLAELEDRKLRVVELMQTLG
jgi:valyl-tRNA synthetase